jgi:predicted dehydrogenase
VNASNAPIKLAVVGAGSRGAIYADYALQYPDRLEIVGVAEPREFYRQQMATKHNIASENITEDWRTWLERTKFADGLIITTPDAFHAEPAIAFAKHGYHLLLEKPMSPNEADCRRIVGAVREAGVMLAVCHVLRYTTYTKLVKNILDSGQIGEIISVQHLEPVGFWHQAHSFVRGNWHNEARSSSMLLQKSCHDLDWLSYIISKPCTRISSFGSLRHFTREFRPQGAADRCLDCGVASECPYDARRFYFDHFHEGDFDWPLNVITTDISEAGIIEALQTGDYGRCVYGGCDNDVVDHQVVNMEFEGGTTASFTMTAFTKPRDRETRIFGTKAELYGNGNIVEVYDFLTRETKTFEGNLESDGSILSGHGGGDEGIMDAFVTALAQNDPSYILSGPTQTLESHLMVFAAETARKQNRVMSVSHDNSKIFENESA